jgi:deoxyxylulose-5-phosphate synthase
METKDLLLIAPLTKKTDKITKLLKKSGVKATVIDPQLARATDFSLFSKQLSTHRYIAKLENSASLTLMMNNFLIQNSIFTAQKLQLSVPDMWVQFGSNIASVQESELDAEHIADRILQELVTYDYRPFSKRKEKTLV